MPRYKAAIYTALCLHHGEATPTATFVLLPATVSHVVFTHQWYTSHEDKCHPSSLSTEALVIAHNKTKIECGLRLCDSFLPCKRHLGIQCFAGRAGHTRRCWLGHSCALVGSAARHNAAGSEHKSQSISCTAGASRQRYAWRFKNQIAA